MALKAIALDLLGLQESKEAVRQMLLADNCYAFWETGSRGHIETVQVLKNMALNVLGTTEGPEMIRKMLLAGNADAYTAARNYGHTEAAQALERMVTEVFGEGIPGKRILKQMQIVTRLLV